VDVATRKQAAQEFLALVSAGKADEAKRRFLAPGGRHHNAWFPAGWDAILAGMKENHAQFPKKRYTVKRVVAEGQVVAVHGHVAMEIGDIAVVHILRFEGGRIAEMWDVGQPIPPDSPNQDGAF
jgi:predicted SnoaL-like aldol condensation-catalyzing enzyme